MMIDHRKYSDALADQEKKNGFIDYMKLSGSWADA